MASFFAAKFKPDMSFSSSGAESDPPPSLPPRAPRKDPFHYSGPNYENLDAFLIQMNKPKMPDDKTPMGRFEMAILQEAEDDTRGRSDSSTKFVSRSFSKKKVTRTNLLPPFHKVGTLYHNLR